jgi:exportin-T
MTSSSNSGSIQSEIARAVSAALTYDPKQPNLQRDAYTYLEQIKAQHAADSGVWQSCLEMFLSGNGQQSWSYAFQPEARMFGLQVVDEMLSGRWVRV